jgi:hypothetical protein
MMVEHEVQIILNDALVVYRPSIVEVLMMEEEIQQLKIAEVEVKVDAI